MRGQRTWAEPPEDRDPDVVRIRTEMQAGPLPKRDSSPEVMLAVLGACLVLFVVVLALAATR